MKLNHHGKAEPLRLEQYLLIRKSMKCELHKLILDICYYTGERISAVLQLKVEDVYLDARDRRVRDTIIFRAATRKNNDTRECPLNSNLALRLQAFAPPESGYLFPSPYTDSHLTPRAYDAALRRALERAGLADMGFSTHSTRRGFITRLHECGISPKVIQSITGHKSLAVLAGYIDVSEGQRRSAVEMA